MLDPNHWRLLMMMTQLDERIGGATPRNRERYAKRATRQSCLVECVVEIVMQFRSEKNQGGPSQLAIHASLRAANSMGQAQASQRKREKSMKLLTRQAVETSEESFHSAGWLDKLESAAEAVRRMECISISSLYGGRSMSHEAASIWQSMNHFRQ